MATVAEILETMDYGPAPEAADEVRAWLAKATPFGHLIDGARVPPATGETFATKNPATGETLAEVAMGGEADIDAAVAGARAAFPLWAATPGSVRARHLYAIARLLQKRARFFAVLETLDNGKPIRESRDIDVPLAARHFYHHAGWAELAEAEFPGAAPYGVCAQVIPWNFPLLMLAWKVAPAIAAGNTVVLKPAEYTPLTALAFAALLAEAGLPRGVVNIVTGDGRTGALLVAHEGVDKVAFTGSTEVGREIRRASAGSGKALSLELGGKSPFIVFEDADLDSAVEGVVDAIWLNQGEVCCAGSRLLLQEPIAERFLKMLAHRMETLRVGDPLDKSTDIGAIVDTAQLARIETLVAAGIAEGATPLRPAGAVPKGCFYPPTVLTGVAPASRVAQEEIFGPVAVSLTFRTPDEAIKLADNTRYGLAASVWSESINVALDIAGKLQAGVVWINATNLFDAAAPFGGVKESGFGREGGRAGMAEYLKSAAPARAEPGRRADFAAAPLFAAAPAGDSVPALDRTPKLYVGGKQARPDSGHSYTVTAPGGRSLGQAALGSRKDVRNAVEAAHKAAAWSAMSGHQRAQVLYFLAENLEGRAAEFADRLAAMGERPRAEAEAEVAAAIGRITLYAAYADKHDGRVHETVSRHVTLAMNEPFGVMGIVCPAAAPLLGFVSLVAPAIAAGNRVVAVPSAAEPFAATDLYQVLDTSDVPGGVVNIVTGDPAALGETLAAHDDVAALWHFAGEGREAAERASAGNLKATWCEAPFADWRVPEAAGRRFLDRATTVKTIWIPYGA